MGRSKRKIKRNLRRIPLSFIDKLIYCVLMIAAIVLALSLLLVSYLLSSDIAFADETIIASDVGASPYWAVFPLMWTLFVPVVAVLSTGYNRKQPIFGNKHFKPKWDEPTQKTYPIFSRKFRESITPKAKKVYLLYFKIFAVCLLVSILIFPLGLFSRESIDSDYRFIRYNTFNRIVHQTDISKAQSLTIGVVASSSRGSSKRYPSLKFKFEDSEYSFDSRDFMPDKEERDVLEYLLYLKSFFEPEQYEITDTKYINYIIDYGDYTPEEVGLIYRLFDYNE